MSYVYETQYDSPNYTPAWQVPSVYGRNRTIEGFTYHWWGDPNNRPTYEGVISWLSRPNGSSSAHYVLEDGRVACIVAPNDAAWHAGNALGNASTIGIEMNPRCSEGDYRTAAEFSAQLIDAFGDQIKYMHRDWMATQCPGNYDINRIDRESYLFNSGADWGDVTPKDQPAPATPAPQPPVPSQPPVIEPEWIRNLNDIVDTKLTVLPAEGTPVINLNDMTQIPDSTIPRGTQIDIAKETTVGGRKFYLSNFAVTHGKANGIYAENLGEIVAPPVQEKPEWLKNLQDIEDKDFWTRSETPVLNLEDGTTNERLPINTKVRITHATQVVGTNLLVVDGQKTAIETIYLSDTPISNPTDDLEKRVSWLERIIKAIIDFFANLRNFK